MRVGSLFSGAGGLDMAAGEVFGAEVAWHSEIDPAASKVLAHRFPGVPNLGDISAVDWATVPPVDVLCGGFPCQDVSAAGKRAGIKDGTRSGLWSVFAEAIDVLRPQYVVVENVRGLLSATAHRNGEDEQSGDMESAAAAMGNGSNGPVLRAAGAVLGDLADLGYDAQWTTVAASDVGAPHRRERVFILATDASGGELQRWRGSGAVAGASGCGLGAAEQRQRDGDAAVSCGSTAPDPRRPTVGQHPGGTPGPQAGAYPSDRSGDHRGERADVDLLPTPNAQDGNGGGRYSSAGHQSTLPGEVRLLPTPRTTDANGAGVHGTGGQDLRTTLTLLCTPSVADSAGGHASRSGDRSHEPLLPGQAREMATAWGKYEPAIRRWETVTRPAPAPTEPNKNGNPRLSAAFSEWLMGWPQGWVTDPAIGISRNDQLRIVGNGVVPMQCAAAIRYLLSVCEVAA